MTYKSPAEGIKDLLVAAGVGIFPPDSATGSQFGITIGQIIDSPIRLIIIKEYGGKSPEPRMSIDYPSVQVRVRAEANGYLAARGQVKLVKDALLGLPSQDLNGDRWTAINAVGDIVDMGVDKNDRPAFVMNFALIIEPAVISGYRE